jgi:hypothetical protein
MVSAKVPSQSELKRRIRMKGKMLLMGLLKGQ